MSGSKEYKLLLIILIFIISFDLTACSNISKKTDVQNKYEINNEKGNRTLTIGLVVHNQQHQFMANVSTFMKDCVKDYENVKLLILDSEGSNEKQINQLEYLINKKVDGIILNPNDPEFINQEIEKIHENKIPLVILNMKTNGNIKDTYVGTNDFEAGVIQGNFIVDRLQGKGNILILLGNKGQDATVERYNGLISVIKNYSNIRIVEEKNGNWEKFTSMKIMDNWVKRYKNINAVVCQNDEMMLGALTVTEKIGMKIDSIGVDAIPEALEAVKEGRMSATVLQDARLEAQIALSTMVKKINGDKIQDNSNIPYELITNKNVDEYLNETYYLKDAKNIDFKGGKNK